MLAAENAKGAKAGIGGPLSRGWGLPGCAHNNTRGSILHVFARRPKADEAISDHPLHPELDPTCLREKAKGRRRDLKLLHFSGQSEKTYIVRGGSQDGNRNYTQAIYC